MQALGAIRVANILSLAVALVGLCEKDRSVHADRGETMLRLAELSYCTNRQCS